MKKILFSIIIIGVLSSCSKFLEQSSQDLIKPTSVTHYKELLQGESYYKNFLIDGWFIETMTDNLSTISVPASTKPAGPITEYARYAFIWDKDIENPQGTFTDNFFQSCYKNIITANTCISSEESMIGTESEKNILIAQAKFIRAYGYFLLANLYAKPYNYSTENDLCVPLNNGFAPTLQKFQRATMKEVWGQMSSDIDESVTALSKDNEKRSINEISYRAALILASRIALFKGDYNKVITYGEKYLSLYPNLTNISTSTTVLTRSSGTNKCFLYQTNNEETAFRFGVGGTSSSLGSYYYFTSELGASSSIFYSSSESLLSSYEANDKRRKFWFIEPALFPGINELSYFSVTPSKVIIGSDNKFSQHMRTAEVYLNLAEAYARIQPVNTSRAVQLLNDLRIKRISPYTNLTEANFATNNDLISFIMQERRRELCFEEFHRWWDLRRFNQPQIEHFWYADKYVLNENDGAYLLNIPKAEIDYNPTIVQNERPIRQKVN